MEPNFQYIGEANLGGTVQKYFLRAHNRTYLFKPGAKGHQARFHQPFADALASKMAAHLLDDYIPAMRIDVSAIAGCPMDFVRAYAHLGGSVQPFLEDAKPCRHYTNFVESLQKEQVLDWLISNHDAHIGQFICKDKTLYGVDKSQAMRYFGIDSLSPFYHPNKIYGEDEPIYNHLTRVVGIVLKFDVIGPTLERAKAIPNGEYLGMFDEFLDSFHDSTNFHSFMKGMHANGIESPKDRPRIHDLLLKRKDNLHSDFKNYYGAIND